MASLNPVTGYLEIEPSGGRSVGNAGAILDLSMFANVILPGSATVAGTTTITSSSASALAVGRQGSTNPVLQVDASTASVLTGLKLKGAGTGAGFAISVVETGGTNNALTINSMGSGAITIGGVSTGNVQLGATANSLILNNTTGLVTIAAGGITMTLGTFTITSGSAVLTSGNLTLTSGNLLLTAGNITMTLGTFTLTSGNMTLTAGNLLATLGNITATAGNIVVTTGDFRVTTGNYRAGAISAFGTTEPTSAVVLKAGTAPVGAITTSSGLFASATVLRKIIADGTVSNVET